jgi:hypothetical protein
MGFARTATGLLFLSFLGFYLVTVGQLTDEAKWSFVVAMSCPCLFVGQSRRSTEETASA